MKFFPEFLSPFRDAAKNMKVGDISFSGPTYQVQVEGFWVFLQLNGRGRIADIFCTCEEEGERCVHMAAAYLALFRGGSKPLHHRFYQSLWYVLCRQIAEYADFDTKVLKETKKGYEWASGTDEALFVMEIETEETRQLIKKMLEDREEETETTSIKFSNLSAEELELWRAGRPTHELKFELSFWSDLAKWMMLEQEKKEPYSIDFKISSDGIPHAIIIGWLGMELTVAIPRSQLQDLIPSLSGVVSPLAVYRLPQDRGVVRYDQKEGIFHIEAERSIDWKPPKGHDLGEWIYVLDDGFYEKETTVWGRKSDVTGHDVSYLLEAHSEDLKKLLTDYAIYDDPMKVNYHLSFDEDWNLVIEAYVNHVGDLSDPLAKKWDDWVFVPDDGFYLLEDWEFHDIKKIIPEEEVALFVIQNRLWINSQAGFSLFLQPVEVQITYAVDKDGNLRFKSDLTIEEEYHDFGHWIYIAGQGFYQKKTISTDFPLPAGTIITSSEVSHHIRTFKEELKNIPRFFCDHSFVESCHLSLKTTSKGEIVVDFSCKLRGKKKVHYYDEYVYVEGEGFHLLPLPKGFPKKYCKCQKISQTEREVFVLFELPRLLPFAKEIDDGLRTPQNLRLLVKNMKKKKGGEYSVDLIYKSEWGEVDATIIREAMEEKKRFLFTSAGLIDCEQTRFRWLKGMKKITAVELFRLSAFELVEVSEESKSLFNSLTSFEAPTPPDISGLQSQLRPYQHTGLQWLWFLYTQKLSGLLCDDMGLGKTHMAMALLAAIKNAKKKVHFLVICPTSVIYHWQDKLHTFLPGLRVLTFYGTKRSHEGFQEEYDILLTSYGVWRRESQQLKKIPFACAILDEIQMGKNPNSKLHQALRDVNAQLCIGMTGTPIENYLQELKALFDLVLPGYMPGESEYRDFFVKPIEKEDNRKRRHLLSAFVHPFILRRKKEEVLNDLPEKMEEITYCALLPEQLQLYQEVLAEGRKELLKKIEDQKESVPYVHVFALLSRLKQVCDHPAVLNKEPHNYESYHSGKWERFVELIDEARSSEQKVVVFSQYLAQLDIIESHLRKKGIGYAGIRGATLDRGRQVKRFQEDPACEVFVASLQAAGLGIDLTAGSVVIHYDRWWNAARENQATDRVHRIGQSRGVQVFKLVTRGTFEERIDAMIARKGQLMEDVIGTDDQEVIKQFSREELVSLLQDVHFTKEDQRDNIEDLGGE